MTKPGHQLDANDSLSSRSSPEKAEVLDHVDENEVKRAVLKMDLTILPIMTMLYLLSFLDRSNIGNARVAGLQKGLHMTDHQYQIAVTITYVPYVLSEIPANLILRKVGPNLLMPTILTFWGIIVLAQGFVTSFRGLIATRAFLGLAEGPMLPGIVLYLSGFYTREELSLRIALFFSAASLSGAFSGLLAAAIVNMHGVGNKPAWAWIFILEGIFTIIVGLAVFFLIPATPKDSRFLSDRQKKLVAERLNRDRPAIQSLDTFSIKQVLSVLVSPHVFIAAITNFMGGVNLFGLALFLPSIVNQLGFSPNHTQLLSVGPFAVGFAVTLVTAYLSDKYKARAASIIGILLLSVAGYSLSLASPGKHASYAALYLMVPGAYAIVPIISAWFANNTEPHYRRATSIALGLGLGNCGGILSTWSYPSNEGPKYRKTTIMNLVFSLVMMVLTMINALLLIRLNRQKKERRSDILAPYASQCEPDGGLRAWNALGDRHPDFKYVI
uniref:Major facilitator superfamily (MFS) profile domain-containing protein n=1 Tax=Psilocybe cubensis TaxID=181762 RepID=A0A8H7XRX8_PSICU